MKKNMIRRLNTLFFFLSIFAGMLGADGVIIIPRPPRPGPPVTPYPLEVRSHLVDVSIKDNIAVTEIRQEFYNPTLSTLEGVYIFPIPVDAAITSFSMEINGARTKAELLDSETAKKTYEDIVRTMKDPAMLEYAGRGAFRVKIYPIEPHSTKKVSISYGQLLDTDSGITGYVYPLKTGRFSSKPVEDVSIRVEVTTEKPMKMIYSPSHQVDVERLGDHRAAILFQKKNVLPDRDFSLFFSTHESRVGADILTYDDEGEGGFFILNISPSFAPENGKTNGKNMVFILDSSGSMSGKKIEQAKRALGFCIENLNPNDTFEIIRFSTAARNLFGRMSPADPGKVKAARNFIDAMEASGGTNIGEALEKAFDSIGDGQNENASSIVFITDGKPTVGKTSSGELLEIVKKNSGKKARVFVFGIDHAIDTHLLDLIARESSGYRTYVSPDEDIEMKVSSFYEKIRFPVISDIEIDFGEMGAHSVCPAKLPDLFRNSQVLVTGRYRGKTGAIVKIYARRGKEKITIEVLPGTMNMPAEARSFIPRLWAAQHVGYLLDTIRLEGENPELRKEIIRISRKYGIITPYTSFLIIEDNEKREFREEDPAHPLMGQASLDREFRERISGEFGTLGARSGKGSVNASSEVFALQKSRNLDEIHKGSERLSFKGESGIRSNLSSLVKYTGNRAFYWNGKSWVDSNSVSRPKESALKIRFASEEYFDLLSVNPGAARFLSMGRNLIFLLGGRLYEIYD